MIELVLSVCLLDDPSRCKDVALTYSAENLTPMQCLMQSPVEISKWTEAHPKWFTKRWTCRPAGHLANL
jgi:hypothetical protein